MKPIRTLLLVILLNALVGCESRTGNRDASGTFETTEIIVSSQTAGQIMRLDVAEGQTLSRGERVGYVDTIQLHLKKVQLEASLQALQSGTRNVSRQVGSLREQLSVQQNELRRFENLFRNNAATQKQVDDIHAGIGILQKQIDAQTEILKNTNEGLYNEAIAMQAQVKQVGDMIEKSAITSPIDGTVLVKYAEPNEITAQGKALFKIGNLDQMFLRAYITAEQLSGVRLGQEVRVFADFERSMKEYSGSISWISEKAEFTPKTIQTKNERANQVYAVKIAVRNDGYLKIGMYGEVSFE